MSLGLTTTASHTARHSQSVGDGASMPMQRVTPHHPPPWRPMTPRASSPTYLGWIFLLAHARRHTPHHGVCSCRRAKGPEPHLAEEPVERHVD
jgi:hypothetical protein